MGENSVIVAAIEGGRVTEILTDPAVYPESFINITELDVKPDVGWYWLGDEQFIPPKKVAYFENDIIVSINDYPASANIDPKYGLFEIEDLEPMPQIGWTFNNGAFEPITKITTGAMQRRFTIPEEVAILESSDTTVKVIRDRLLNASHADLKFEDTYFGIAYICNVLFIQGVIEDWTARTNELLKDGVPNEKYSGIL
ncbi:MAG: hypothetical protein HRT38_17515 [Alteromonadaceae bacterium]|nr:hypothetical protein [Alteromonadaceae bacterium]